MRVIKYDKFQRFYFAYFSANLLSYSRIDYIIRPSNSTNPQNSVVLGRMDLELFIIQKPYTITKL